jgi:hypothetical protein
MYMYETSIQHACNDIWLHACVFFLRSNSKGYLAPSMSQGATFFYTHTHICTVKPGLAVTRFQRSLFVWGHFKVLPMHFKRYFNWFQRSSVERGQRSLFTSPNRMFPLFSAGHYVWSHDLNWKFLKMSRGTCNYKQIDRYTGTVFVCNWYLKRTMPWLLNFWICYYWNYLKTNIKLVIYPITTIGYIQNHEISLVNTDIRV